jgi:uncharacterized protein YndB with AHSA1/START domain
VVQVRIAAEPATVFQYLADPQRYRLWMGAESTIDPREGGELTVKHGPGPLAVGRIVEFVPDRRLVFTWGHRPSDAGATVPEHSSRVTITLEACDEGTLVTLTHTGLPTQADRQGHLAGWRYYLSQLSAVSWERRMHGRREALVDAFFSVWNEPDSVQRDAALRKCTAENVAHRDRYGCIDGRAALHGYIGGVLGMMQGARIERAGPVEQVHAYLRCAWKLTTPDGGVMAAGADFFQLDREGLIRSCVGFWDALPGA